MSDRARIRVDADRTTIAPPSWVQTLVVLAGVALPIGLTLGVLGPR